MATTVTLKPNAIDISGSTSGTTTLQATAVAGTTTLTLPAATDTLVGKATTDTLTNKTLTGAVMNGTLGATTPSTASVTTLTTSSTVTHNGGTANGVPYLNGSKVLTTGSDLVFDGTNLGVGVTPSAWYTVGGYKSIEIARAGNSITSLNASDIQVRTNSYLNSSGVSTYANTGFAANYEQYNGTHFWYTAPSGTAGTAITFTQAMTLNTNGVLALQGASTSANGVGITFPATQSASSNANTLDDYEEGTWSPILRDSNNNNFTMSIADGRYTKIGNQVTASFIANWSSLGSATSSQLLCTLPFASASSDYARFSAAIGFMNGFDTVSGTKQITANLDQGVTYLTFYQTNDNAASTNLPANAQSSAGGLQATITYFV